jgi:hypothetical protein
VVAQAVIIVKYSGDETDVIDLHNVTWRAVDIDRLPRVYVAI